MPHGVLWRAKSRSKSFIHDSNLDAGTYFGVGEFPAIQNPAAHCLEISRPNGNHHGVPSCRTPIHSEWSPAKGRGVQRKKFCGTSRANSREVADPIKYLLKIGELPLIQLMRRAVQRDAYGHDSFHAIAAVDSHQVHDRASHRNRSRQKNHREHHLCANQAFANQPRSAGPGAAPCAKSVNAACVHRR